MTDHEVEKVVIHPVVLESVADSHRLNQMGKIGHKRVAGVLLGSWSSKGVLNVFNSFDVPFYEDDTDMTVWFLDKDYLKSMANIFKDNAHEKVVGWYHTGPKLHQNDEKIDELFRHYCPSSVLVVIDAKKSHEFSLPDAYCVFQETDEDGTRLKKKFKQVRCEIRAEDIEEAEKVRVEHHLFRDVEGTIVGSSQQVTNQFQSLSQRDESCSYSERVNYTFPGIVVNKGTKSCAKIRCISRKKYDNLRRKSVAQKNQLAILKLELEQMKRNSEKSYFTNNNWLQRINILSAALTARSIIDYSESTKRHSF